MSVGSSNKWIEWFDGLQYSEQRCIALAAIARLIEIEEVSFHEADKHDPSSEAKLYWDSCGEDLRIPF